MASCPKYAALCSGVQPSCGVGAATRAEGGRGEGGAGGRGGVEGRGGVGGAGAGAAAASEPPACGGAAAGRGGSNAAECRAVTHI